MKVSNISTSKIKPKGMFLSKYDLHSQNVHYAMSFGSKTYAKVCGLRSMQNIKGFERDIIEAYRKELSHDIWGNPEKMKKWTIQKVNDIAEKDYKSSLLDDTAVKNERNDVVKEWLNILNKEPDTKRNPFLLLKIMKFVTKNLLNNNKALAPVINPFVLSQSVHETAKSGLSFEKIYYKNMRDFDNSFNVNTEEITENGIKGKWYIIKVPYAKDAIRRPGLFARINN